jgi:hypothetical protein
MPQRWQGREKGRSIGSASGAVLLVTAIAF